MGRTEFFFWFDFRIYRLDSQFYIKFGVADPLCDSFYQFYRGLKKQSMYTQNLPVQVVLYSFYINNPTHCGTAYTHIELSNSNIAKKDQH